MPQLIPLRGLRYTEAAGRLDDLLAPPYDVITEGQRQSLAARNPFNAVHLELATGGDDRYEQVANLLRTWESNGVLARDEAPQYYVYEQRFTEFGRPLARRGILCGVEAQPWDEGAVKPHEFTMSGPKEDRLKLLQATQTQLSPVFMIARDRAGQLRDFIQQTIASRPPDVTARMPDDEEHLLWAVEAGRFEARHLAPLLSESFYIADGHHRYETAVNFRDSLIAAGAELQRDHPARFALTSVVAADDPGLVIRPIHRIVPRPAPSGWRGPLNELFEVVDGGYGSPQEVVERVLAEEPRAIVAVGLEPENSHILRLKDPAELARRVPAGRSEAWAAIMPNVIRYGVLEPLWSISDADVAAGAVEYSHDPDEVFESLARHEQACAFFINPITIGEVMALADQGERMPQKSTFFYPKLSTGLVFHPLY